jgi:hypothetical protein
MQLPLWFLQKKMRSETIFRRKNLPKPFDKRSLMIVRYELHQALKTSYYISTMFTRIDNFFREMRLNIGKLFDMYKTLISRENYIFFLNAHVCGHLKAKKLQLKQILKKKFFPCLKKVKLQQ